MDVRTPSSLAYVVRAAHFHPLFSASHLRYDGGDISKLEHHSRSDDAAVADGMIHARLKVGV